MITVEEAERIILDEIKNFGTEEIHFTKAAGRVLAENIYADRDLPPFDRITVDGAAIAFTAWEKGLRHFSIIATQAAGDTPVPITNENECIEVMTGSGLPQGTDTIIRYEDIEINGKNVFIKIDQVSKGQNLHYQGKDKQKGDLIAERDHRITPAVLQVAVSAGKEFIAVYKTPKTVIISSGNELVEVNETPAPFQVRRSNNHTIKAILQKECIEADMLYIPDDADITKKEIENCLQQYDVILISGGISMGKFDYVPAALEDCGVKKLFHKVQQRPGKPFWFGRHGNGVLVFAFPGNPVSVFMCVHRYFMPWLQASLGVKKTEPEYALLAEDYSFMPPLQYFLQVKLFINKDAQLIAKPLTGNGSGDFANLIDTDAFMELPLERNQFYTGEVFRIWRFV